MMETQTPTYWRKCTTCKTLIAFGQKYWICSVSTCTRQRTGLVFCKVSCFDAHVPVLNHRDAGAIEKKAPTLKEWGAEQEKETSPSKPQQASANEILVVVSKVKAYIREKSDMSTSDRMMEVLSDRVRSWSDQGIRRAEQSGRKPVMDRDF